MTTRLVPGAGFVQETSDVERLLPDVGFIQETIATAVSGTGAVTLPVTAAAGTGTVAAATVSGSGAALLQAPAVAGTGTVPATFITRLLPGPGSGFIQVLAGASSSRLLPLVGFFNEDVTAFAGDIDGSGAVTLPHALAAGSGFVEGTVEDSGAVSLPQSDLDGAGTIIIRDSGTALGVSLPLVAVASVGRVMVRGDGELTMPVVSVAADGAVVGVSGVGVLVLPQFAISAGGSVGVVPPVVTAETQYHGSGGSRGHRRDVDLDTVRKQWELLEERRKPKVAKKEPVPEVKRAEPQPKARAETPATPLVPAAAPRVEKKTGEVADHKAVLARLDEMEKKLQDLEDLTALLMAAIADDE